MKASDWGEVEESKVLREFRITDGRIQTGDLSVAFGSGLIANALKTIFYYIYERM